MNDLIRTTVYLGLGAMVLGRKKFEEFVEELIQNNDLTKDEGKRLVQEFIHSLEDGRNNVEIRINKVVDDLLLNLNLPTRHEIDVLIHEWKEKLNNPTFRGFFRSDSDKTPVTR